VAIEKGSHIKSKESKQIKTPPKFSVWKMQSGLPVFPWNAGPWAEGKPKGLNPFTFNDNVCSAPKDGSIEYEEAKCAYIGVDAS
jgi:hypothetical protein